MNPNKQSYIIAEQICRRAYEKEFNLDLSLPIGHIKNAIVGTPEEVIKRLTNEIKFWDELCSKFVKHQADSVEEIFDDCKKKHTTKDGYI